MIELVLKPKTPILKNVVKMVNGGDEDLPDRVSKNFINQRNIALISDNEAGIIRTIVPREHVHVVSINGAHARI